MPRPSSEKIKVLIVDDELTFGEALSVALGKEKDLLVVEVVTDGESAINASEKLHPDVVLMDLLMPGMDGIEATRRIVGDDPETSVIVLTGRPGDVTLARAIRAGAAGCLQKTEAVSDLAVAVRRAARGEPLMDPDEVEKSLRRLRHRRLQEATVDQRLDRLTPRELEILQLMADGLTSEEIAPRLEVSPHTLRTHVQNVLTKLKVHSKLDAVVLAIRHGKIVANLEAGGPTEVVEEQEQPPAPSPGREKGSNDGANAGPVSNNPGRTEVASNDSARAPAGSNNPGKVIAGSKPRKKATAAPSE